LLRSNYHFLRRTTGLSSVLLCLAAAAVAGPAPISASAATGVDPAALESRLYSLLQQDRWRQGDPGLVLNQTMAGLARSAPHQSCGGGQVFHGRAEDMAERNYFAHQIPPCGALIFPAVQAAGVPAAAEAENIGWTASAGGASADVVNSTFMASADHRANILGPYNSLGVGAWPAPSGWGPAGGRSGVVVFAVIFARVPGVFGPAPPPPPPQPAVAAPAPPLPTAAEPAPQPPEPSPTSQVLADHDGVTLAAPLADMMPEAVTGAAVGPAFLLRVVPMLLVLAVAPAVAAVATWRGRRDRTRRPDGGSRTD
jgi:hypothetical protein